VVAKFIYKAAINKYDRLAFAASSGWRGARAGMVLRSDDLIPISWDLIPYLLICYISPQVSRGAELATAHDSQILDRRIMILIPDTDLKMSNQMGGGHSSKAVRGMAHRRRRADPFVEEASRRRLQRPTNLRSDCTLTRISNISSLLLRCSLRGWRSEGGRDTARSVDPVSSERKPSKSTAEARRAAHNVKVWVILLCRLP